MQEKPTLIYIPPNVGGGAKGINIGGITTVRNIIEGLAVFVTSIFLMLFVRMIIRAAFISWIIVFVGLVLGLFCLVGVNGEPMSVFFMNVVNYNNRRIFVTLRPPMPKEKEKQVFGSGLEQKIQALVTKNPKEDSTVQEKPDRKQARADRKEEKAKARDAAQAARIEAKAAKANAKRAAKIEKIEKKAARKKAKVQGR